MLTHLIVGGLVAAGFDPSGQYLLTVSHSGRGVFCTRAWQRIARDYALAYPENGTAIGIGPIEGQAIAITELDYETETLQYQSPDGRIKLRYESGTIFVEY
jgi:hypothetical protein